MAEVPPAVVTVTSTTPRPAGAVAVTEVAVFAVMVAAVAPKSTAVAEPRFVPVMTTLVLPVEGPLVGRMLVTVGTAVTVSVKDCEAGASMPLAAVKVMGKAPLTDGVPVNCPPVKVTPVGSVPDSVITGTGEPDAVGVNVPITPWVNVVEVAEVNDAGE